MRFLLGHTSLCIAIALTLSACNGQSGSTSKSKAPREGVLRVAADAEPQSLDPQLTTGHTEHRILTSLFEGLTTLNQKTLEVEPGVAKTWEISEDGRTYTFHLNPDAKWSDGAPMTANDFVYSFKRILSPKFAAEYSYMPWCIENAEAFNKGTIEDFAQVGVKAIDNATLEVKLAYPAPYFLSMQMHNAWFPVQQATIEKHGKIDDRQSDWILAGNMVSNGPFKLAEWKPNELIRVVRNEHYWDAKNIKLNEIEFYPVNGNLQTAERMFRAGEVDTIETLVITKVPVYKRDNPSVLKLEPFAGTYFYRMNVTRPPLDDPRVRLALAMSVDKESVCNDVLFGAFTPANALTPPGLGGYTAEAGIPYDLAKAKALLAEAGYPDGKGMRDIEILYNESEDHQLVAEAVQDMWKKGLGINVVTNKQEWKVYLSSMTTLNYDVVRAGWIADFLDPMNYCECFTTDNGNNRTGWSNPQYDELEKKARHELDPKQRFAYMQEAEKLLLSQTPIIPIYTYRQRYLINSDLQGCDGNILNYMNYKYMSVTRNKS
ncbi:MAG: peptide ABC transporter substrate-binding protein [Candidatus Hydrogenedentes bacterium]|nr:peptide ABC transporter substrate-binding protein [Candidatus Hydrogenedentota bacterium]